MKKIVKEFLLAEDKFMPEMRLRHPSLPTLLADHFLEKRKE